jgi:PAS domain S-box-containing protein
MDTRARARAWQNAEAVREWINETRSRLGLVDARPESPPLADDLEAAFEELQVSQEELRAQGDELAEAAVLLEQERRRYHELFDSAPDAYIVTNLAGSIHEVNRAAARLLGAPQAAIVGVPLPVFIAPDERHTFRTQLTRLARLEHVPEWETRIHSKTGADVPIAITASALDDPDAEEAEVRWLMRDITDRKRAEAQARQLQWEHAARVASEAAERRASFLAQASASLSTVLGVSGVAERIAELAVAGIAEYCIVDLADGGDGFRRVAAAHADESRRAVVQRLLEYAPSTNRGSRVADVLRTGRSEVETPATDGFTGVAGEAADVMEQLAPRLQFTVPLRARGRTIGVVTVGVGETEAWETNPLAFAESFADRAAVALDNALLLEEMVAARDLAQRANEAKAQFLATLSHEFRTPLTAVIGYSELLTANVTDPLPERLRTYVERIRASAAHQLSLVEQILDYASLEGGVQQVHFCELDFCEVARAAADLVRPEVRAAGLRFALCAPDAPLHGASDEAKLRQVLSNLLSNAIQFTERGEIRLDVSSAGGRVIFSVSDTGIGIPADQLPRVFDRFWRADSAVNQRRRGVGLGLNITRQLVLLLGGEITVKSQQGAGTTFTVRIPSNELVAAEAG